MLRRTGISAKWFWRLPDFERSLIATGDGSLTLKDPFTGELYHNKAGAYTEALENYFFPSGALARLRSSGNLGLLDICFGLGYNSFVLLEHCLRAKDLQGRINILAVELDRDLLAFIPSVLEDERFANLRAFFLSAKQSDNGPESHEWSGSLGSLEIRLKVLNACLRSTVPLIKEDFDLVFHDPFSPKRRPEFWTIDLFKEYYRLLLAKQGTLLTYSSAVAVRTALRQLGFSLLRTVAVGEKTGGTIAYFPDSIFDRTYTSVLTVEEESRLQSRSAVPYRDPGLQSDRALILRTRQLELDGRVL